MRWEASPGADLGAEATDWLTQELSAHHGWQNGVTSQACAGHRDLQRCHWLSTSTAREHLLRVGGAHDPEVVGEGESGDIFMVGGVCPVCDHSRPFSLCSQPAIVQEKIHKEHNFEH